MTTGAGGSMATKLGFPHFAKHETRLNLFQFREILLNYVKFREMDLDEISS